ncbi:thiosulfate oxidation carrier protein SoxY [Paracoccus caeni]|uniref:Thiosulfate oxidation carrier protein SoxY n=1 Tax=Paracoccus caeni TaxID=657651 RepID=A0A934W0E5_9RHOB|nr:thiosulfate oxidation carrier protein SoxY [Paracoccus caeni]MBK4216855.1 thiosulfate oxidation carrier protein SoxY [Paracoccus caeni]
MTSFAEMRRRQLLLTGAALGAGLAAVAVPFPARAQISTIAEPQPDDAESDRLAAQFLDGQQPVNEGLVLELPALGDNPAAVPLRVHVTEAMTGDSFCEEIIVLASRNPLPLACRFRFTPMTGSADVAVRVRLIQSMKLRALARMSDGRVLQAKGEITVAAGGCGM